ncbi:MAG: cadherin repeat domain-containing protein [Oceanobacter sp.]
MIDFKPIVRGRTHAVRLVVTDSADESLVDVTGWRIRVGLGRSRRALGTEFTKESTGTGDGALLGQVQIDFNASETSGIGPHAVTVDVSLSSTSGLFRPVLIGAAQVLDESEYLERFIQNQAGSGSTSQVANSQTESVSVLLDMSDDPATDIRVNAILEVDDPQQSSIIRAVRQLAIEAEESASRAAESSALSAKAIRAIEGRISDIETRCDVSDFMITDAPRSGDLVRLYNPGVDDALIPIERLVEFFAAQPLVISSHQAVSQVDSFAPAGYVIFTIQVNNSLGVVFSLESSGDSHLLVIDSTTGAVELISSPDSGRSSYSFTVVATNAVGSISMGVDIPVGTGGSGGGGSGGSSGGGGSGGGGDDRFVINSIGYLVPDGILIPTGYIKPGSE